MEEEKQLTVQMWGIKAKSKSEMYRLLATDGRVYLPPLKQANYRYIRDILTGNKEVGFMRIMPVISMFLSENWKPSTLSRSRR